MARKQTTLGSVVFGLLGSGAGCLGVLIGFSPLIFCGLLMMAALGGC